MALLTRPNNLIQFCIGNGIGDNYVYGLSESAHTDYGSPFIAINGYWQSGYFQDTSRLNFGYLHANAVGSGTMNLLFYKGEQVLPMYIRPWTLSTLGTKNMERQIQKQNIRGAMLFGTNSAGDYFSLQGFTMYVEPATWAPVRGVNF